MNEAITGFQPTVERHRGPMDIVRNRFNTKSRITARYLLFFVLRFFAAFGFARIFAGISLAFSTWRTQ